MTPTTSYDKTGLRKYFEFIVLGYQEFIKIFTYWLD